MNQIQTWLIRPLPSDWYVVVHGVVVFNTLVGVISGISPITKSWILFANTIDAFRGSGASLVNRLVVYVIVVIIARQ